MDEWGISVEEEVDYSYKKPKGNSIWDVMNSCITKKIKPTENEKKKINEFQFHKLLARFENSLDFALMFDIKTIPVEKQWDIINILSPKGVIPFEKKNELKKEAIIDNISDYYNCNTNIARQYFDMMPEEEINRIADKYKKGQQ